ncbi:MAG TPA: DUF6036 family nucleotidyltransferase [Pyrinomonadaceae bacterium]|nr:DUF6036 family nucleotidyltransferase [Pyrinomonadaceae bacterium]
MLNQDFRDMLLCLTEARVDFMIVGAYALAAHGFPRATGDIDIWVRNSSDNANRVMSALAKFGAPLSGLSEQDFMAADMVVQVGVQPCRIDITTGIDGIGFNEAWENKMAITVDGIDLFVPSKADLLKNKVASGRDKDQGDVAWLKRNLDDDA